MPAKNVTKTITVPTLYRANRTIIVGRTVIPENSVIGDDHPLFAGREECFDPIVATIESATANPGERRRVSPPKAGK